MLCYGYSLVIDRIGKFQLEKAQELGIPQKCWSRLQKGETQEVDGRVYTPDMVLGEPLTTLCNPLGPTSSSGSVRSALPMVSSMPGRPLIWSA